MLFSWYSGELCTDPNFADLPAERRANPSEDISYKVSDRSKTAIYESFEPLLNAGEIELLDVPKLQEQLLTLVVRGSSIDHPSGSHDDFANAACGALTLGIDDETRLTRLDREEHWREHGGRDHGSLGSDPLENW